MPLIVLIGGLLATLQVWNVAKHNREQELREYFDFRVRQAYSLTEQRLAAQELILRGAQGLFAASGNVSRKQFRNYVAKLHLEESSPGIQGVGFSQIIPADRKVQHIAEVRKQGYPQYNLRPEGERDLYTSIVYLEPLSGLNLRAFGYDMYSEPVRRKAMESARDNGFAALSGKVKLVQETEKNVQAGFLIYMPVYRDGRPHTTVAERRANIIGWVFSPLRMNDFVTGMYGERASDLDIEIYDGEQISADGLMFDSDLGHYELENTSLQSELQIHFANHAWTLLIRALPSLKSGARSENPSIMLYGGIPLSLLLAWLAWLLITGRERALGLAREMNHELFESETKLRAILDSSAVAIAWANNDGLIEYINPQFTAMFGYTIADIASIEQWYQRAYPDALYRERMVSEWNSAITRAKQVNSAIPPMELSITCKDGSVKQVMLFGSWAGTRLLANFSDITRLKQVEQTLKESEERWKFALEGAGDGVWDWDIPGNRIIYSQRWYEIQGYAYGSMKPEAEEWQRLVHPDDLPRIERELQAHFRQESPSFRCEHRVKCSNGEYKWVLGRGMVVKRDAEGRPLRAIGTHTDISERKRSEEKLVRSEASLRAIIDNIPYLVWLKDTESRFIAVNLAFLRTTGRASMDDVIGKTDFDLWPGELAKKYRSDDLDVMDRRLQKLTEESSLDNGEISWVETFKAPIVDSKGNLLGTTGFARDITEKKHAQEVMQHMAHYDPLTDLPNRILLTDRLQQALAIAKRDRSHLALMFIDLDRFKPVNDELGHEVGDLLLSDVARRMQFCVRESDTVARIGGDEFVVLLSAIEVLEDALMVAEKIRCAMSQPFEIAGHTLRISSSIGVAFYPEHGINDTQLMKHADIAMYQSKMEGRDKVVVYRTGMGEA